MVDAVTALFNMFGPWAVVIVVLIWGSKFLTDQMDKARADRLAESDAHREEVGQLTEVISNNTLAIQKLTDIITKGEKVDYA